MNPIIPSELLQAVLQFYVLESSDSITVKLFVNDITPDRNTDSSDFMEASYDTYDAFTLNVDPAIADLNQWKLTPGHATFAAPSTGSPVDLYGMYVVFTPADAIDPLLFSMRFDDAPLTLAVGDLPLAVFVDFRDFDANNP